MSRPTAAPAQFPYAHRTLAEVDASAATPAYLFDLWINGFWPHMRTKSEPDGRWLPSRYNSARGQWQIQSSASTKWYLVLGTQPTKGRVLANPPNYLKGAAYAPREGR